MLFILWFLKKLKVRDSSSHKGYEQIACFRKMLMCWILSYLCGKKSTNPFPSTHAQGVYRSKFFTIRREQIQRGRTWLVWRKIVVLANAKKLNSKCVFNHIFLHTNRYRFPSISVISWGLLGIFLGNSHLNRTAVIRLRWFKTVPNKKKYVSKAFTGLPHDILYSFRQKNRLATSCGRNFRIDTLI